MTAQLMNSANTADRAPSADEERATTYRSCLGYFGAFTLNEARGVVTPRGGLVEPSRGTLALGTLHLSPL